MNILRKQKILSGKTIGDAAKESGIYNAESRATDAP